MPKSIYLYEIEKGERENGKTFAILQTPNGQTSIVPLLEGNQKRTFRAISAHNEKEAQEDAEQLGRADLLISLSAEDLIDLLSLEPGNIDPLNVSNALYYAEATYSHLLSEKERNSLMSSANKIRTHLIRLFA